MRGGTAACSTADPGVPWSDKTSGQCRQLGAALAASPRCVCSPCMAHRIACTALPQLLWCCVAPAQLLCSQPICSAAATAAVQAGVGLWYDMPLPGVLHLLLFSPICQADGREGASAGGLPCPELNISWPDLSPHVADWHELEAVAWQAQQPRAPAPARLLRCMQHGEFPAGTGPSTCDPVMTQTLS